MSGKYAFTKTLKEVRFHMCHTGKQSDPLRYATMTWDHRTLVFSRWTEREANHDDLRNFLLRAYPTMKKNNPHTPIMIREALDVEPKVYARYGMSLWLWQRRLLQRSEC